ncbi:hypothetical protein K439DRAFT_1624443 [Ramaria rubella]|nr:hypothetical protein K439DRAFT_1624443 [Ramaria rubella]
MQESEKLQSETKRQMDDMNDARFQRRTRRRNKMSGASRLHGSSSHDEIVVSSVQTQHIGTHSHTPRYTCCTCSSYGNESPFKMLADIATECGQQAAARSHDRSRFVKRQQVSAEGSETSLATGGRES